MQIIHDRSYVSQAERELIARGYARESLYSLRFQYVLTDEQQAENRICSEAVGLGSDAWDAYITANAKRHSQHMERVAAVMAQNFRVCQYDGRDEIRYNSDWDLFFWCNDFSATMRGLLAGRDYSYFTLSFNEKHSPERRQKIYDRAMRILALFAVDENLQIAVQYEAVMDDARIKRDAELAALRIVGRNCVYNGMEGRIEQGSENLYFRKKRSRKYVYRLTDTEILSLSWQLSA